MRISDFTTEATTIEQHLSSSKTGRELLVKKRNLIAEYMAAQGIRCRSGVKPKLGRSAAGAGRAAGANVRFHAGVASGQRAVHALGAPRT